MKHVAIILISAAMLAASAASARPLPHRHQVCSIRHHHKVCVMR